LSAWRGADGCAGRRRTDHRGTNGRIALAQAHRDARSQESCIPPEQQADRPPPPAEDKRQLYGPIPEVAAIGAAKRDRAAVAIDAPRFAGDVAFSDEGAQVFGGCFPGGLSIGARLTRLGRVDSP
jgi:hypothetical protein